MVDDVSDVFEFNFVSCFVDVLDKFGWNVDGIYLFIWFYSMWKWLSINVGFCVNIGDLIFWLNFVSCDDILLIGVNFMIFCFELIYVLWDV